MDLKEAIRYVHTLPEINAKVVVAMAGSGSQAIGELLKYGRGSNTLLAQHLLYDNLSFDQYVSPNKDRLYKPDEYVSEAAARQLAMSAYQEALRINSFNQINGNASGVPVGIGGTSSLAKPDGEREGRRHSIFVATQTRSASEVLEYTVQGSRENEEWFNALVYLRAIAVQRLPHKGGDAVKAFSPEEWGNDNGVDWNTMETIQHAFPPEIAEVLHDSMTHVMDVGKHLLLQGDYAILSGSFNPLHEGHLAMAKFAEKTLNRPVVFELSIANADKPPLDYIEIAARLEQFRQRILPVVVTNRSKFIEKSAIFKAGTIFIMGLDTYDRLGDERYYRDSSQYVEAMRSFADRQNRFLVFPQHDKDGKVKSLVKQGWHDPLYELAIPVSTDDFVMQVSSSELRRERKLVK